MAKGFTMRSWVVFFVVLWAQVMYAQDVFIENNPYDQADESVKRQNAFNWERWFYEQRMYPNNYLPDDAYVKALRQREEMRSRQEFFASNVVWTNIGPTSGFYFSYGNISSRITTIQYDPQNPNVVYLGAAFGGVWKSFDGGATWIPKMHDEVSLSSGALAIDPTNTWSNYTSGLPTLSYFSRLVIRPQHPNELLAALGRRNSLGVSGGLYGSTNGGAAWTLIANGRADDVVFSPSGDTAYAIGSGIGYRVSTDGGATFTPVSALAMQTRNHLAVAPSSPNIVFSAHHSSSIGLHVYKSTDAGATFTRVGTSVNFNGNQAWYDFYIYVNPFDPNYVYVGSIDIWRSTDGGTTFQNITNGYSGGSVHVDQHNLAFHPTKPDKMFCVNDGGVWHSTNRGTTWTNRNATLTLTQFYRIAFDPINWAHLLGGTQDNGTQRTLGSINWTSAFGGMGARCVSIPKTL